MEKLGVLRRRKVLRERNKGFGRSLKRKEMGRRKEEDRDGEF